METFFSKRRATLATCKMHCATEGKVSLYNFFLRKKKTSLNCNWTLFTANEILPPIRGWAFFEVKALSPVRVWQGPKNQSFERNPAAFFKNFQFSESSSSS